jgi:hypothetical protein
MNTLPSSPVFQPAVPPKSTGVLVFRFLPALLLACLLTSCAAGTVDRVEDRYDRREDRYDRRTYSGPGDHLENRYDRRENVNDKVRGRRGLYY